MEDETLVANSQAGDKQSLEQLIKRYQAFVFNICVKAMGNSADAADMTQEILIRVITSLNSFRGESSFKTWLYRIAVNHLLNYKRAPLKRKFTFAGFGQTLDEALDAELPASSNDLADTRVLVEETKQTCMSGMLLCLDKRHRLVFILSELFAIDDKTGGYIMAISPENFRMRLSRAKRDLYNFMNNKCGLINQNNPCRCAKKTNAFIDAGFVDPRNLRFTADHRQTIEQAAGQKNRDMENLLHNEYRQLYLQHTYLAGPDFVPELNKLLASEKVKSLFNLQ
jgi:RNA polymerase sigma factor (sigma-70 family)